MARLAHQRRGSCRWPRGTHDRVTLSVHDGLHVGEVAVDDAGTVMMSEMPCTACRRMSSAMRKASKKLVPRSTVSISRSLE